MIKSIIKEIIIILLLLVAIVLALGVLFYDYIPTNKIVPSVASYTTPEDISKELEEANNTNDKNSSSDTFTYQITSQDLKTYEKTKDYKKGKSNPFSTYETTPSGTEDKNNVANTDPGNTSVNPSTNTQGGGTFYNSTGTK